MAQLKLTKKDFKKSDNYWSDYVGKTDVSDYKGDITIEGDLGWVRFDSIKLSGYLTAEAGSGIKAGEGIEAGWGIKAGEGIKAGSGIEAGEGIVSGLYITCKLALSFKYNLFAGVAWYKQATGSDKTITCGKLQGGTVCYGDVVETGMPDEKNKNPRTIEIEGAKYRLVED